jgi:hypothetical protein
VTTLRALLVMTLLACLSACSTVGHYERNHILAGESLELRRDKTFHYEHITDSIGDEYEVEGTWHRDAQGNLVTTVVTTIRPGPASIDQVQTWRRTMRGFAIGSDRELQRGVGKSHEQ